MLSRVNAVVGNKVIWKEGIENAVPTSQMRGMSHRTPKMTANTVIAKPINFLRCKSTASFNYNVFSYPGLRTWAEPRS